MHFKIIENIMTFIPTKYKVQCVADGRVCDDSGWMLDFPNSEKPSLIRAIYAKKQQIGRAHV